jgi:hypothetical protein
MGLETSVVAIKSGGKVLGNVDVQVFADIPTAISYFETLYDAVPDTTGESHVLNLVNNGHRTNVMNTERAKLTRSASPMTQLKRAMKADPAAAAQVQALLVSLGIAQAPEEEETEETKVEAATDVAGV